jgi:lysophospholipase L1-like esterase
MRNFPVQTAASVVTIGLLLTGASRLWPSVKGPNWSQAAALLAFTPDTTPVLPLVAPKPPEPAAPIFKMTATRLLEDSGGALDHFYAALWRAERREAGAVVHVVHYGDSPTTADLITGDIRALLQSRYGDAGHGFVLIAKPWAWYEHRGVEITASGWQMFPATHFETRDGLFGLGGVSMMGEPGATSRIVFRDPTYSRFELWYLRQPNAGVVAIQSGDRTLARIDTAGETAAGFAAFEVPGGAGEIALTAESGPVRVFGISAEKPVPGVVYDTLGLNGASVTVLSRIFKQSHLAEELRHRNPDLVVINYGTNEADFDAFIDGPYEKELREAVRRIRAAVPEASILLMSPMDRGRRVGLDGIETMPTIPRIVAIQSRVARETGCGFFDTFEAMGGAGTMARWYNGQPRLVSADFIHPTPAGGKLIAEVFVKQVNLGLNRFKWRETQRRK